VPKLHGVEAAGLTAAAADKILAAIKKDLEILRQFNWPVDRLERSGFSKRYEREIPNVIAKMEDVTFERGEGPRISIVACIHSWIEDFSQAKALMNLERSSACGQESCQNEIREFVLSH
jgi:hypothetical protein